MVRYILRLKDMSYTPLESMTTLHENIRRLREKAGATVSAAAEAAGLHRVAWTEIEAGRNPNPTPKTLEKIAGALEVELADLFLDENGESVTL